jgi:hypothetical protein
MSDATPVASSATPDASEVAPLSALDQAIAAGDMGAFKAAKLAERAGTLLTPSADQPGDPAPPAPDDQAASTEASPSPASEPGKPGHKGNADTRKAELQREIDTLLAQRRQLRDEIERHARPTPPPQPQTAQAASSPAAADAEPKLADFEANPEQYPDPYVAWLDARQEWKWRQLESQRQEQQQRETQERSHRDWVEDTARRARDLGPELVESLSDEVRNLRPLASLSGDEQPTTLNFVTQQILESDAAGPILKHLSDHPEELRRLEAIPKYASMVYEVGKLAARLSAPPPPPQAKVITSAPPPPTTTGNRPTEPVDALEAAVRSGDMTAFKALKQRERQAARAQR